MNSINIKKRAFLDLFSVIIISILLSSFFISIHLIDKIISFFNTLTSLAVDELLINCVFFYMTGLLWIAYRKWRKASKNQRELEDIISSITSDVLMVIDPDGKISMCNPTVKKMFGYETAEVINQGIDLLFFDRYTPFPRTQEIYDAPGKPDFYLGAVTGKRKGGDTFPLEIVTAKLSDGDKSVLLLRDISSSLKYESEYKYTRNFLDRVLERSLDSIVIADCKGFVTRVNKAFLDKIGHQEEAVVGRHTSELSIKDKGTYTLTTGEQINVTKDFFIDSEKIISQLLEKGEVQNRKSYFMCKTGMVTAFEQNMSLLYDEKGDVEGAVGILRDISEREEKDREIKEAKEYLENIFKTSADAIIITSNGIVTMINEAFERMLGYSKDELIGQHSLQLTPKEDIYQEKLRQVFSKLITETTIIGEEMTWLKKDGSRIEVEVNASLLKDVTGSISGVVSTIRDISKRKEDEMALKKSEEKYHNLIDHASDAIISVNDNGVIVSVNKKAEEMFCYNRDEIIGKSITLLSPPAAREHQEKLIGDFKADNDLYIVGKVKEGIGLKKSGEEFPFEGSAFTVETNGEIIITVILRDISERKKIDGEVRAINRQLIAREQKLRSINQQLQASNQQLRERELALRESEEKYRLSTEYVPVHLGAVDQYGKFILWNKYSENMLGYRADEVIGKLFSSAIHESKEEADEVMRIASANGLYDKEINLVHKNQSLIPAHLVVVPKKGGNGEITGFYGFAEDITERKKAEEAIRTSEEKYHNLIQNANDGIISINEHGIIIGFNNKAEELFGYRSDEVMGKHVALLTPEDKREGEEHALAYFRNSNILTTHGKIIEREGLRKDGSKIPLEATWSALGVGNGYIITSIVRDVSERKKAEKEIRKAKEFLEKVIESSKDGIIITDEKRRMLSVNKAIAEMSGFTKEELIGQQTTLFAAEDKVAREKILQKMAELFEKGFCSYESIFRNKAGALVEVECNSSIIKDDKGNAIAGVTLFRDVTERQKIEKQLHQSEKLKSLGELAGGVAHDFNNVLAAILGRAQLLRMSVKLSPGALQRGLDVIEKAALDGAETVRRIQEFARSRADEKNFHQVDINELLENALDFTRPRWKDGSEAKGIKFRVKKDLSSLPSTTASESELREVFTNLINNALDAMTPHGGQLTIKSFVKDNYIYVVMKDSGAGMPKEVRQRIFDPFFTTKGPQSTGLGLSVSYGIIKRHKGTIEVDSKEGKGTSFTIKLPVWNKKIKEVKTESAPIAQRKAKILIIEDEEGVRNVLQDILTDAGHDVESAGDGTQGINLFKNNEFSMVFTDLGMPGMSGWQVAEKIKRINKMIPVALITGWNMDLKESEMKKNNVDFIIKKPFAVNQLLRLVQEGLELQERSHAA